MKLHPRLARAVVLTGFLVPLTLVTLDAKPLLRAGWITETPSRSVSASSGGFHLEIGPELEELVGWLESDERTFSGGLDLAAAVREQQDSFRIFTELHDPEISREVLAGLPFGDAIEDIASRYEVDPLLVAAVVEVESSFRPEVGSHKGAVGLMQLLPSTAGKSRRQLQDPETNLEAGVKYLDYLQDRFDQDLPLTLAAYNAGPTLVSRLGDIPPYSETRDYVEKVIERYVEHHQSVWRITGSDRELSRLLAG